MFLHRTGSVAAAADGLAGLDVPGLAVEVEAVGTSDDFDELLGFGVIFFGEDLRGFVILITNGDFVAGGYSDAVFVGVCCWGAFFPDDRASAGGTKTHLIAAGSVSLAVGSSARLGDEL